MLLDVKIGNLYHSRRNYRARVTRFVSDARRCWVKYVEYEMVDRTFDSFPGEKFVLPMTLFKLWFTESEKPEINPLGVVAVKQKFADGETDVWFVAQGENKRYPVAMLRYNEDPSVPVQTGLFEVPAFELDQALATLIVPVHPYIRELHNYFVQKHPDYDKEAIDELVRDSLRNLVLLSTRSENFKPLEENEWWEWRVGYPDDWSSPDFQPVTNEELLQLELQHPEVARLFHHIKVGDYLSEWGVYSALALTGRFDR